MKKCLFFFARAAALIGLGLLGFVAAVLLLCRLAGADGIWGTYMNMFSFLFTMGLVGCTLSLTNVYLDIALSMGATRRQLTAAMLIVLAGTALIFAAVAQGANLLAAHWFPEDTYQITGPLSFCWSLLVMLLMSLAGALCGRQSNRWKVMGYLVVGGAGGVGVQLAPFFLESSRFGGWVAAAAVLMGCGVVIFGVMLVRSIRTATVRV